MSGDEARAGSRWELVPVGRKGPVLRVSPAARGIYGVDLTAGCGHGCMYCPVRVPDRPGFDERLPFDPFTAEALQAALKEMGDEVRTVVLSPLSDPLPPYRPVRAEAIRVAEVVLGSGRELLLMTRGRFPRRLIGLLAQHRDRARVALGILGLKKRLVRTFEPRAASPLGRIRDLARLTAAGVRVEVRLEPLLPGLTDTRELLLPLFRALAAAGASKVVAHYMFLHANTRSGLETALASLDWADRLDPMFEEGPTLAVGSLGTVRNLPRDARREGLARVMAWGAEYGLTVSTGAAQNPDLPRVEPRAERAHEMPTPPAPSTRKGPPRARVRR